MAQVTAVVRVQSLAWELPCVPGAAKKKEGEEKKENALQMPPRQSALDTLPSVLALPQKGNSPHGVGPRQGPRSSLYLTPLPLGLDIADLRLPTHRVGTVTLVYVLGDDALQMTRPSLTVGG